MKTKLIFIIFLNFFLSCSLLTDNLLPLFSPVTSPLLNITMQKSPTDLNSYTLKNFDYVHTIDGFYIAAMNEALCKDECRPKPYFATSKDVFDHSVRLFSSFLDQDQDGKIDSGKRKLVNSLAFNMFFVIGKLNTVNKHSEVIQNEYKRYAMSMQLDMWPYVKNWPVGKVKISGNKTRKITLDSDRYLPFPRLVTSTWRPFINPVAIDTGFNAIWEETFHTITEAYNRYVPGFSYLEGSYLRNQMELDIATLGYEIETQNREEGGAYDKITAVNEYIHQIWLYQLTGNESKLNKRQKDVWKHITNLNIDFPQYVINEPNAILGVTLKGIPVRRK